MRAWASQNHQKSPQCWSRKLAINGKIALEFSRKPTFQKL